MSLKMMTHAGNVCHLVPDGLGSPTALGFARLGTRAVGVMAFPFLVQPLDTLPHGGTPSRVRIIPSAGRHHNRQDVLERGALSTQVSLEPPRLKRFEGS